MLFRSGSVQTKTFRKDSEASSRAERWRGYVIIFNNEPSCCYTATSERRRIHSRADFHYFALREASIRRSQRSNSEAVLFRGTLPRRYSIRRSRCGNNEGFACLLLPRRYYIHLSQRGNNSVASHIFSLPLWLRSTHLLIVRGNCEALTLQNSANRV